MRYRLNLILWLCLCFSSCVTATKVNFAQRPKSEELLKRGIVLLRLDQIDQARAAFEVSLETYPSAAALDGLGVVALRQQQFPAAEQYFIDAFQLDHEYYQALANLAFLYENQGLISDATRLYRFVLKKDPTNFRARNNFAVLTHEHREEAHQELRSVREELERAKALEQDPVIVNNLKVIK
ncbi:MAG: tetratricopeptide repeat protein [Bdellovibrionales bacterium]|nr:tetratricopeptide repeat protein [Bdellovibrionales bacterium]